MNQDIRWKQRLNSYKNAFTALEEAVGLSKTRPLSKLEKQGLIQGFEYTQELSWNLMKDYLEAQGFIGLIGSKNATREAFKQGLITDGECWMDIIKARNLTSHAYEQAIADEVFENIVQHYYPAMKSLLTTFTHINETEWHNLG